MNAPGITEAPHAFYRCGAAARWLPRVLAAAVLLCGWLVAMRVDPAAGVPGSRSFRILLVVVAAVLALWIVRKGGELRYRIGVGAQAIVFAVGGRQMLLELKQIAAIRYDPPFVASRNWLPATALVDRGGRVWRLPAFLVGGERLVGELLEAAGRDDLRTWAEVLRLKRRMAGTARRVAIGYAVTVAVLVAGVAYHFH